MQYLPSCERHSRTPRQVVKQENVCGNCYRKNLDTDDAPDRRFGFRVVEQSAMQARRSLKGEWRVHVLQAM
jgi:hypothetical protein